jgi:hypothetical protein
MSYTGPYPSVSRVSTSVLLPLLALSTLTRGALAESEPPGAQTSCIVAYEGLQEARARGELLRSRDEAFGCASSVCPAFMQQDCAGWLEEIESEVPTVAFEVRSGGRELTSVRVLEGDRLIVDRIDGPLVELDPGVHWLRFEAEGLAAVTKSIVVTRGEKNQRFSVELPAASPRRRLRPAGATPVASSSPSSSSSAWIAGGVGLAGLTAFAILSGAGLSQEASLKRSCAPSCSDADLRSVQTKYLLADISLGVGITWFLVSGYLLLTGGPDSPKDVHVSSIRVHATPQSGMASVRSAF